MRAFKDQVKSSTSPLDLPRLVTTITKNVEVGVRAAARSSTLKTVLAYALFAYGLPPGHFFQSKLEGLEETRRLRPARARGEHQEGGPGVLATRTSSRPRRRRRSRSNEKPKATADKAPPPRETTITVLNGNGVTGSAGTASYLLSQRGYQMVYPPDGKNANAPNWEYFKTRIHFDPAQPGAEAAAKKVADAVRHRRRRRRSTPAIEALSNGALLTVIVGQTFHGTLAEAPVDKTPQRQQPNVAPGAEASLALLRERAQKLPFPLMVPTVLERSSWIDRERPVRLYRIDPDGKHKTIRLTYRTGASEYWGVQMTDWEDAPVLSERNFIRTIGGRTLRAPLLGPEAAHGRAAPGRRDLLGREHAARLALERDDARDREGSQAAS